MVGKASLFMVLGFSAIFMLANLNYSSLGTRAVSNMVNYYENNMAHNIAVSGINIACSNLYFDKYWSPGTSYTNIPFSGGSFTITMKDTLVNFKILRSVGTYRNINKEITVLLQPSNFAKFGNFYNVFGAAAATGDTFDGPFHANDYCNVYGDPVFLGKVTCLLGLKKSYNPSNPKFLGGFESGVNIPLEFDTTGLRVNAGTNGKVFMGTKTKSFIDVNLVFNSNGTVTYKSRIGASATSFDPWSPDSTVPLSTFAPNVLIYVEKGNVTMSGVLKGRATVVASRKGASGVGIVYIPSSLRYNTDPRINPNSTDMMGIVAEEKVQIPFNNSRGNFDIHASIYAQRNGLVVDSISSYTTISNMNIFGGLIAQKTQPTAQYSGTKPVKGYRFVHKFDQRFYLQVPPSFPMTKFYEIVSWKE